MAAKLEVGLCAGLTTQLTRTILADVANAGSVNRYELVGVVVEDVARLPIPAVVNQGRLQHDLARLLLTHNLGGILLPLLLLLPLLPYPPASFIFLALSQQLQIL